MMNLETTTHKTARTRRDLHACCVLRAWWNGGDEPLERSRWRNFTCTSGAEANPRWRGGAVWVFCDVFGSPRTLRCAKLLGNSWEHEYMELGPSTCVLLPTLVLICQNCYTCRSARQRSLRSCKWDLPRCLRGLRAHAHQAAMVAPTSDNMQYSGAQTLKNYKKCQTFLLQKLPNKTTNVTLYWHPVLVQSCKPNSKNAGLGLHSTAGCMLHNKSWDEQIVPSVGSTRRAPKTESRCSSSWPCTLRKTLSNAHSHGQTKFSHVGRQHKYWNISTLGQTYTQAQNHHDKTKSDQHGQTARCKHDMMLWKKSENDVRGVPTWGVWDEAWQRFAEVGHCRTWKHECLATPKIGSETTTCATG